MKEKMKLLFLLIIASTALDGGEGYSVSKMKYSSPISSRSRVNNELVSDSRAPQEDESVGVDVGFIPSLQDLFGLRSLFKNFAKKTASFAECLSCKFAFAFLQHYVENGATENDVESIAYKICTLLHIETPRVCAGVTKLFKGELTQVVAKVLLNPSEVCGLVFTGCGVPVNPLHDWTVPLTPFPKPPVVPPVPPKKGSPVLKVLHISDVHIDPYYKEGTNANCGEPLCCRETSGKPAKPSDAAGYFGDVRDQCDIPLRTFENMLLHINKTHKIDYVIWTGDIPPHDIWNTTRNETLYLLRAVSNTVQKYIAQVPVFPALGNHESAPVNSFPLPITKGNESISWLYDEVAKVWSKWIPGNKDTIKLGAYYSVRVNPGLKIISLNTNYCNSLNWWLLMNTTDPTDELAWLVAQLQMSEDKNEKVHIIGHIPPGEPDCLGVWSRNYYQIINRYESTVTAQFFGHTHHDQFEIFYDKSVSPPRPSNIAYIGPSVTTYEGVNPGYRIYTVDGDYPESSRVVLDHETYYTNLTEANMYKQLKWEQEYSMQGAFNMSSLQPAEWESLVQRFEDNDRLFYKFYRFFTKMSDYPPNLNCDSTCKKTMICKLRRGQSNDPVVC